MRRAGSAFVREVCCVVTAGLSQTWKTTSKLEPCAGVVAWLVGWTIAVGSRKGSFLFVPEVVLGSGLLFLLFFSFLRW